MTDRFEMSMMRELEYLLGFEINQYQEGSFIKQAKYTQDMLKRFKMHEAKPMKTPMSTTIDLNPNLDGKEVDQKVYHSMIGSFVAPRSGDQVTPYTSPRSTGDMKTGY